LYERACAEVDRRLARYQPTETDPAADAEMRRIMLAGMKEQTTLPELPVAVAPSAPEGNGGHRRRRRKSKPASD
jgi:hypothetical protein